MIEKKWKINYRKTLKKILVSVLFKNFFWYITIATIIYSFDEYIHPNTFYAMMTFFLVKGILQGLVFHIRNPVKDEIVIEETKK